MSKDERRKAILMMLNESRRETRANLAFELGVSKRTIEYDVANLSLEYPIYTVQGKGGGIYVLENFHPDRNYLNEKQTELLERLLETLEGEDRTTMQGIIRTCALPQKGGLYGRKNP